ncbi:efflux RND transporter permease subunit [Aliivibrio kagoshimensis]|uniref:efflux RND transporter permease subunit n=1 Tax=Aliivibrio kagoshimensis TaxID=2910230 RepID=UPI003D0E3F43
MKQRLLSLPTQSPRLVILFLIGVVFAATIGGKNLYFRGDYNIFFDGTNPQLQAFDEIQNTFTKSDNISIVIAPDSGNVFSKQSIELIQQITADAWQTPYSNRVDSITNYQHTEAIDDDLLVEDLALEENPLTTERIEKIKKVALSEPTIVNALVSEDGHVAVVNITVQMPRIDEMAELVEIMAHNNAMMAKYQQDYPNVTFHKGGLLALNNAFMESAQNDSASLVPTMLVVILLFLGLMLRSFIAVASTLLILIASILATMGIAGWSGLFLNTATVNVPTFVMTLAVADCVHIIATLRQTMQKGLSKTEAITHSIKLNFLPILITSVTTAIGFIMLNASDSPVFRDLGNLTALGIMIAFVLSVTLLPALLQILPYKVEVETQSTRSTKFEQLADFIINKRQVLLPLSIAVVVAISAFIPQNRVNDESVKYFDTSNSFRQAADFMQENISGMSTLSVVLKTGQSQGINSPEFISDLGQFTDWLRQQPEIDHISSLSDTFKRLNKNMHGDDPSQYLLPDDRELAAQYLLLYEMSLPYGLDLNNQINIDKSSVKLQLTIKNLGSNEFLDLENRINHWIAQNIPDYQVLASSPTLMFAHIGESNMDSMIKTLPIALVLISGLLIFALRSVRLGLISLIPNLVPAAVGFGIWGMISGEINLGLSIVVTLTLGIVVDDTVHFLSKYQYSRKLGNSTEQAIRYAFSTVGRALWITSVVLIAGFSVLSLSDFRLNSDMGQLSALIIGIALIVDFIMLPTLLMIFDKSPEVTPANATIDESSIVIQQ